METPEARAARQMLTLRANAECCLRQETLDGRAYLVVPVVALVAGVLNGELVPAAEIGAYVGAWNDAPVPVGHPERRGLKVSARTPDILASAVIGRFYNVEFAEDRLRGELWLDIAKAQTLGGNAWQVVQALQAGQHVEVSTAYFRDLEAGAGEWQGQKYYGVCRHIRPDHLALLPGAKGACSWADGCGAPRVNEEATVSNLTVNIELTLTEQELAVRAAWYGRFQPDEADAAAPGMEERPIFFVWDVYGDRVIVRELGPVPRYYAYAYTVADDGAVTFEAPAEVEVVYQPVAAVGTTAAEPPAGNAEAEAGAEPEPEPEPAANGAAEPEPPAASAEPEPAANAEPEPVVTNDAPAADPVEPPPLEPLPAPDAVSVNALTEVLAALAEVGGVAGLRAALVDLRAQQAAERADLLTEIQAQPGLAFNAADLAGMTTLNLRKLAQTLKPVSYAGRGGPQAAAPARAAEPVEVRMPGYFLATPVNGNSK
jgi:outer membrane biosynthesis protein TonB